MNSETKVVGLIGIITIIIIAGGLWLVGKNSGTNGAAGNQPVVNSEALVRPDSPRITGKNAGVNAVNPKKIQIVEFGDLECPACHLLHPELKKLLASNGDDIELVIRFIPIHSNSKAAAGAALAAGEQGKFFEMYDIIFEHQDDWAGYGKDVNKIFEGYATQIGLNVAKYKTDLATNFAKYSALVDRDANDATTMNISSTPTLIFNGTYVAVGAFQYEKLKSMMGQALSLGVASSTATSTAAAPAAATAATLNLK